LPPGTVEVVEVLEPAVVEVVEAAVVEVVEPAVVEVLEPAVVEVVEGAVVVVVVVVVVPEPALLHPAARIATVATSTMPAVLGDLRPLERFVIGIPSLDPAAVRPRRHNCPSYLPRRNMPETMQKASSLGTLHRAMS
jgi:hypothetical protein